MLFSDDLIKYDGPLPENVKEAVRRITDFFNLTEPVILKYDEFNVAIAVSYEVSRPLRGPVNNIDIREKEPVLIVVSLNRYPDQIPSLCSNRKDFPRKNLPHLYYTTDDKPAKFCLVRNSPNEWFADKRIEDLLAVGEQWLFKAANGLLVEDGNEFDPIRLEDLSGYHIYKYKVPFQVVKDNKRLIPSLPYAILLTTIENTDGATSYQSTQAITLEASENYKEIFRKYDKALEKASLRHVFTPIVWREDNSEENDYCTTFPSDYSSLKKYMLGHGIDLASILKSYLDLGLQLRNGIPLIHAIKRPKKIVGYDGDYEFINFLISGKDASDGNIPDEASVCIQIHNESFSTEMAHELSGGQRNISTLFVGAGSLGSKMIVHNARSGLMKIGAVDHDKWLDHNMARSALFKNRVGANKAASVIDEIGIFFKIEDTSSYVAYEKGINFLKKEDFEKYEWLVDTTASVQVKNFLVTHTLPKELTICRCELVDDGRMGLLYIEGKDRNPRIDDLMALTHFKALTSAPIQAWRKRDAVKVVKTLNVGLGCSSTTTVMSDEIISFHASVFSRILYSEQKNKSTGGDGYLFRSIFDMEIKPMITSESEIIKPFESRNCQAGSGWEVRFIAELPDRLLALCREKGEIETGGILIGVSNYKTRTIHVFDIVVEPQGSGGTCSGFTRGSDGLPSVVDNIKEQTGNVIGYVGEWHTHPMNLEGLSGRDIETIEGLKILNRKVPIPTCALIVTNSKILPFIFE